MFTIIGVAAVGKLWLHIPIPRALYPAAAIMLGGACMVMLPNILGSDGTPGALTTGRAWLGFAASVGVWLGLVAFVSLLQASGCRAAAAALACLLAMLPSHATQVEVASRGTI